MVQGCKRWNDNDAYFVQTNNALEAHLRARGDGGWLESCGPTALIMCLAAMGVEVSSFKAGAYEPQPEDVAFLYLNDSRNAAKFRQARPNLEPGSIPGNRVPQYYPPAALDLFGVKAAYRAGAVGFDELGATLREGKAVQLCLITPGHYFAAVAFDDDNQEIVYHDPWPGRLADGNGFCVRMSAKEFTANVKPFAIVYQKKGDQE